MKPGSWLEAVKGYRSATHPTFTLMERPNAMFHPFFTTTPYRHRLRAAICMLLVGPAVVSPAVAQPPASTQSPVASQPPVTAQEVPRPAPVQPRWKSMWDGKTLGKWQLADQEEFAEHGKVHVDQGNLVLERGYPATGIRWSGPFPRCNYEIELDAKRTDGGDFFCGLTFPVGAGSLTLITGGWGGWAVGLSCINGEYAIDNETCTVVQFQQDRWYSLRLRVTDRLVKVWIDGKPLVHLDTEGKELIISDRLEPCLPLGLATWYTSSAVRKIRYRVLEGK